jgi:hypothetical protein
MTLHSVESFGINFTSTTFWSRAANRSTASLEATAGAWGFFTTGSAPNNQVAERPNKKAATRAAIRHTERFMVFPPQVNPEMGEPFHKTSSLSA